MGYLMRTIRFYGTAKSLRVFRGLLRARKFPCGPVVAVGDRYTFGCVLSAEDRRWIDETLWRAESGLGRLASGVPLRWNDCVSFLVDRVSDAGKAV